MSTKNGENQPENREKSAFFRKFCASGKKTSAMGNQHRSWCFSFRASLCVGWVWLFTCAAFSPKKSRTWSLSVPRVCHGFDDGMRDEVSLILRLDFPFCGRGVLRKSKAVFPGGQSVLAKILNKLLVPRPLVRIGEVSCITQSQREDMLCRK